MWWHYFSFVNKMPKRRSLLALYANRKGVPDYLVGNAFQTKCSMCWAANCDCVSRSLGSTTCDLRAIFGPQLSFCRKRSKYHFSSFLLRNPTSYKHVYITKECMEKHYVFSKSLRKDDKVGCFYIYKHDN